MTAVQDARAQVRVRQIVDAVLSLMQEKGSNAVSMQAIARAAGVSVGLLYKYFSDKEQILLAVITRVLGAFRTRVPEAIEGIDDPVVAVVEAVRRAAEAGDLRDVPPEIFAYDLLVLAHTWALKNWYYRRLEMDVDEYVRRQVHAVVLGGFTNAARARWAAGR